jgi:polar amino acid transport system substrate-binding protein
LKRRSILLTVLSGFCGLPAAAAEPVLMVSGEWAPFTGEKLERQGFITDVVQAAAQAAHLPIRIVFLPWSRAETMVADGEAFATYPYFMTAKRREIFNFSDVVYVARSCIFYLDGVGRPLPWTELTDFKGATFGAVRGYWYIDALERAGIRYELTNSTDAAFTMLKSGRFEYLIEAEFPGRASIAAQFPNEQSRFKTLRRSYSEDPLSLMISRKYPGADDLLKRFNAGLAAIRKNGSYATIMEKHGIARD